MLASLFGALSPQRAAPAPGTDNDFAPTLMLESPANASAGPADRKTGPSCDLLVTGRSPEEVCRRLMTAFPTPIREPSMRRITLFDPARQWAGTIVKLLADASGEALERVYLRRQDTLATLAVVEQTPLPRRLTDPLLVSQIDVRGCSLRETHASLALLSQSHLAVVMLPAGPASGLDSLLDLLKDLVQRPEWKCPNLLLLGSRQPSMAKRLEALRWPAHLNVEFFEVRAETLASASAVWNAVLHSWNRMKRLPQRNSSLQPVSATALPTAAPKAVRTLLSPPSPAVPERSTALQAPPSCRSRLDPSAMLRALQDLMNVRGVLGAALADSTTGRVLGHRMALHSAPLDLEQMALMLSEVLKAQRRFTLGSSCPQLIEEVMVTQPCALQVLRTLGRQPQLFLFVVLDRAIGNLALARHAVARAEKSLG